MYYITFYASNNKIRNNQKRQDLKLPNHTESKNSLLSINQAGKKFKDSKGEFKKTIKMQIL
jgi:hypothetical protein